MKKNIKEEKGVALITLVVTVIILMMLTTMLLYNIKDSKDTTSLLNLYSDIDNLREKISLYYLENGTIPVVNETATVVYTNNNARAKFTAVSEDNPIGANDTGKFLIIDLKKIDGLTLNYGRDYEKVKNGTYAASDEDVYIINEDSHNIFYYKGITVEGHTYYTNMEKDTEEVEELI